MKYFVLIAFLLGEIVNAQMVEKVGPGYPFPIMSRNFNGGYSFISDGTDKRIILALKESGRLLSINYDYTGANDVYEISLFNSDIENNGYCLTGLIASSGDALYGGTFGVKDNYIFRVNPFITSDFSIKETEKYKINSSEGVSSVHSPVIYNGTIYYAVAHHNGKYGKILLTGTGAEFNTPRIIKIEPPDGAGNYFRKIWSITVNADYMYIGIDGGYLLQIDIDLVNNPRIAIIENDEYESHRFAIHSAVTSLNLKNSYLFGLCENSRKIFRVRNDIELNSSIVETEDWSNGRMAKVGDNLFASHRSGFIGLLYQPAAVSNWADLSATSAAGVASILGGSSIADGYGYLVGINTYYVQTHPGAIDLHIRRFGPLGNYINDNSGEEHITILDVYDSPHVNRPVFGPFYMSMFADNNVLYNTNHDVPHLTYYTSEIHTVENPPNTGSFQCDSYFNKGNTLYLGVYGGEVNAKLVRLHYDISDSLHNTYAGEDPRDEYDDVIQLPAKFRNAARITSMVDGISNDEEVVYFATSPSTNSKKGASLGYFKHKNAGSPEHVESDFVLLKDFGNLSDNALREASGINSLGIYGSFLFGLTIAANRSDNRLFSYNLMTGEIKAFQFPMGNLTVAQRLKISHLDKNLYVGSYHPSNYIGELRSYHINDNTGISSDRFSKITIADNDDERYRQISATCLLDNGNIAVATLNHIYIYDNHLQHLRTIRLDDMDIVESIKTLAYDSTTNLLYAGCQNGIAYKIDLAITE